MRSHRTSLGIIFVTVFIDLVGFGIVIPLIAVYGRHFGASALQLGVLGAAYSAMQFLFAPLWGTLSDKIGRRPVLIISLWGSTLSYLLFGMASSFSVLLLSRILGGVCAANIGTAQSYIADITPPGKRSSGLGLIGAAFGLGFTLGPCIGGVLAAKVGLAAPGLCAAAICALNATLAIFHLGESLPPERRTTLPRRSLLAISPASYALLSTNRSLRTLCLMSFVTTLSFAHLEQCFALFFQHRFFHDTGAASYATGLVLGWSGILGAIGQGLLVRPLERRWNDQTRLILGLLISGILYLSYPFLPTYASYFFIALFMALGATLLNPALSALTSKSISDHDRGSAFGLSQGLSSLARVIGPFSAQLLFSRHYALPFVVAGALNLLLIGVTRVSQERQ